MYKEFLLLTTNIWSETCLPALVCPPRVSPGRSVRGAGGRSSSSSVVAVIGLVENCWGASILCAFQRQTPQPPAIDRKSKWNVMKTNIKSNTMPGGGKWEWGWVRGDFFQLLCNCARNACCLCDCHSDFLSALWLKWSDGGVCGLCGEAWMELSFDLWALAERKVSPGKWCDVFSLMLLKGIDFTAYCVYA